MPAAFNLSVPGGLNANPNQKTFLEYIRTKNLTMGSTISELVDTFPCIESATVTITEGNKEPEIKVSCAPLSQPPPTASQPVETIPFSSLKIKDVERLFKVRIDDEENPDCSWVLDCPREPKAGTRWLETLLDDLESSGAWRFARAVVADLIIFDRLMLVGDRLAAEKLRIVRGCPMETSAGDARQNVTSCVDYVLGYAGAWRKDPGIGLVAVELRRLYSAEELSAQLICYMVGLQQKQRQRTGKPVSIYGIQTDGSGFLFVRLDGDRKVQTATVPGNERSRIYGYIDLILKSVIGSSPYTNAGGVRTGIEFPLESLPEKIVSHKMMGYFDVYGYIVRRGEDGKMALAQVEEDHEDDEED